MQNIIMFICVLCKFNSLSVEIQDQTKDDNETHYQSKHSVDAGYLQSLDCYTHWWIFIKGVGVGGGGALTYNHH